MASKFISSWSQSISNKMAETFNQIHQNINLAATTSSPLTVTQHNSSNRATLDPQIPADQRMLDLGFQDQSKKVS